MTRHHVIISGTGRTGTTFLVQLLTALGLDTGFTETQSLIEPNCRAGLEKDLRDPDAPYIIKSPWICDYLGDILNGNEVMIDHAIIPIRDLYAAAESRRFVVKTAHAAGKTEDIWGGLWHTNEPDAQETVLSIQLYKLLYALTEHNIPTTLLYFPRLATDPQYLYDKLSFLLRKPSKNHLLSQVIMRAGLDRIPYHDFEEVFSQVSRPELIHSFSTP